MAFNVLYRPSNCIWQGSSTATTGGTITLDIVATAGKLNFRDRYSDGSVGVPLELYDSTSATFEFSYGTLNYGPSGPATDTISARTITNSSNGLATPVAWGLGARNAFCAVAAESFLFVENALAEMNDIQAVNAYNRLRSVAVSATGGSDSRVVRYSAADTFVNAQNTDTNLQLAALLFLKDGVYYENGEIVSNLAGLGLASGAVLWLGTNTSPLLTSSPTPSASLRHVRIGTMISNSRLLLQFTQPIGG